MITTWNWILLGIIWFGILIVVLLLCWMVYKDGKDMEALEKEKRK